MRRRCWLLWGCTCGGFRYEQRRVFALCLLVRHPEAARGAILHEPAVFAFHDDLDAVRAPLKAAVADAMAEGGPAAAIEPFWRYVAGDDGWIELTPALRERMRGSAGTLFGIELGTYERYLPDDEKLRGVAERVRLLVSADGLPVYSEMAARLGERWGLEVETTAGTHAAYHDHPGAGRGRPPAFARADRAQCLARSSWRHGPARTSRRRQRSSPNAPRYAPAPIRGPNVAPPPRAAVGGVTCLRGRTRPHCSFDRGAKTAARGFK